MKRFGRTIVSTASARKYSYEAHTTGSDHAQLAGNCERPVMVQLTGMRDKRLAWLEHLQIETSIMDTDFAPGHGWTGAKPASMAERAEIRHVDLAVRCRKCAKCLQARAYHWAQRARSELGSSSRSWFGTLTLTPDKQFHLVATASSKLRSGGTVYGDLTPDEQFVERCKPLVEEFQRYMKRLRKQAKGLRHIAVIEQHKSGAPHMHVVLHETQEPIRHAIITERWRWGFSKFNLVAEGENSKIAFYVTKYLTKSMLSRILASRYYGKEQNYLSNRRHRSVKVTTHRASRATVANIGGLSSDCVSDEKHTRDPERSDPRKPGKAGQSTAETGKRQPEASGSQASERQPGEKQTRLALGPERFAWRYVEASRPVGDRGASRLCTDAEPGSCAGPDTAE